MNPTIQTQCNNQFSFINPRVETINIETIAHALSNICRFTGHTYHFYSVAEHSLYVSRLVPEEMALEALLHDATEAYVGDVSAPLKTLLPDYRAIEARVEAAIVERFNLQVPLNHPKIKRADLTMLATEQQELMPENDDDWAERLGIRAAGITPVCMAPNIARHEFLARFDELFVARNKSKAAA